MDFMALVPVKVLSKIFENILIDTSCVLNHSSSSTRSSPHCSCSSKEPVANYL